jgi:hypothetical protein
LLSHIRQYIQDGYDQTAFIYDSVTQTVKNTLFRSKTEVAKLAGGMQSLGLKGDTNLHANDSSNRFAMLACAREWSDSFGCFEVLHHMNWLSELMIATQSNYYIIWN